MTDQDESAAPAAASAELPRAVAPELPPQRYIVVEGPIGVGKTSLAKRLAGTLEAEMVLEQIHTSGAAAPRRMVLKETLIVRKSTAPPAA